jgi:hypothetical protein
MRRVSDQRGMLAGAGTLSWYSSARAQLTLSRVSASRFGGSPSFIARASLKENTGRPPNRLTRRKGRGAGKPERMSAEKVCDALREEVIACQHLYNGSMCWRTGRAGQPRAGRSPSGPWRRERHRPVWRGRGVCSSHTKQAGGRGG